MSSAAAQISPTTEPELKLSPKANQSFYRPQQQDDFVPMGALKDYIFDEEDHARPSLRSWTCPYGI